MGRRYEAERKGSVEGNRGVQLSRSSRLISQEITEPKFTQAPLPCESTISKCYTMSKKERLEAGEKCSMASVRIFFFLKEINEFASSLTASGSARGCP